MLIFVYGSLMRGERQDVSKWFNLPFIGETEVNGDLYKISWFPGVKLYDQESEIVQFSKDQPTVHGEVFEVPTDQEASIMHALDLYEGYPDLFIKRRVWTKDRALVVLYEFAREPTGILINSGSWRQYTKEDALKETLSMEVNNG